VRLFDSHAHLDCFARDGTLPDVLSRAKTAGVCGIVTAGTNLSDWPLYARLARENPGFVRWAAGIHPTEIGADAEEALAALASFWATEPCPVALGEVGLDYFHLPKDLAKAEETIARQKVVFRRQLEIALQMDCPVIVHARQSFADSLAAIDASGIDWNKVVFHCFSEGPEEMRLLNARGARGSFTGTVTYKNAAKTRAAALEQGVERLMVETDCPYLAPEPLRGKVCEPAHVAHTLAALARLFSIPEAELADATTRNAERFFAAAPLFP